MNGLYETLKRRSPLYLLPQFRNKENRPGYVSPDLSLPTETPLNILPGQTNITPMITPTSETPSPNVLRNIPAPETKKPVNSLLDYWKQPILGKMPLDLFTTLAGTMAHGIAPSSLGGRMGAGLANLGGTMYGERIRREGEEPTNVLRRRLLEAQIEKAGRPEKLTDIEFFREHPEEFQKYKEAGRTPTEFQQFVNSPEAYATFKETGRSPTEFEKWKAEPEAFEKFKRTTREPQKPLRQLVPVTNADGTTTMVEARAGTTIPTKSDYTPKQAMTRISVIDSTIARLKTTGSIDTTMAIQNPMLAALVDTKDPEAVKQAIQSLQNERTEILKYAPKGYGLQKITLLPEMPDATKNKNRIIRDTETGKRYQSNGKSWVEVK